MGRPKPVRVYDTYVASTTTNNNNYYNVEQPGFSPAIRRPSLWPQYLFLLVFFLVLVGFFVTGIVLFENKPPPTFHLQQLTLTSFNLTNATATEPEISSAAWNATILVTTYNTKPTYVALEELILTIAYIDLNLTTSPLPSFDQLANSVGVTSATASAAGKKLSPRYYGAMKEEIRVTGGLEFDVYLSGQIAYYPLIKGRKHRDWFQGGDNFSLPVGFPPGAAAVTLLPP